MQVDKWTVISKFFRSGKLQKNIHLKAPASSIAKFREVGLDTIDLKLRLIRIELKNENNLYPYQLNFTQAISKMKDTIVLLFNRPLDVVKNLLSDLHDLFVITAELVRANRKYPRNHKIQKRGFYPAYKPTR